MVQEHQNVRVVDNEIAGSWTPQFIVVGTKIFNVCVSIEIQITIFYKFVTLNIATT